MSNTPSTYSSPDDLQDPLGPPPPLPPRRPLPPLYNAPGNVNQGPSEPAQNASSSPQQAFGNTGPPNQGYHPGYGSHPPQYPQPSTSTPAIPPNPPSHQFQNPMIYYGQNSGHSNAPYGHTPPNQPSIYGQPTSSHEETLASPTVPYGYGMNPGQYTSPYGQSATPILIRPPFHQNTSATPYAPPTSPPVPDRPPTAPIHQSSLMTFGPNEQPSVSRLPPPIPIRPWSAAGPVTSSGVGTQSTPGQHPNQFGPSSPVQQSNFYVSTVGASTNVPSNLAQQYPPPSVPVSTLQHPTSMASPPPQFAGPPYQAPSSPPFRESHSPASPPPPTNQHPNLNSVTSHPSSTIPANLLLQSSHPPETHSHSADPGLSPSPQLTYFFDPKTDHTNEETLFFMSSLERYRMVLEKERSLVRDGKSSEVLRLLQEFMESEMKLRREIYTVTEERRLETIPENPITPPPTTVLATNHVHSNAGDASVHPQEVRDTEPTPASTFAAIISQTYSYGSPPQNPDLGLSKSQSPPQSSSTATKIDYVQPVIREDEETKIPSKDDPLALKKFKEHAIPPIPQSESLARLLSGIPKAIENDPSLTPLRERLATLKDLAWLDKELNAFEDREQEFAAKSLEELERRQEAQSVRQTQLYAANKWEIADRESRECEKETQRQKDIEMRQSLVRWRSEYCDPSYEKLHSNFALITDLHKEITKLEYCDNVEEQVGLLNETQAAFLSIVQRLDVLTDELRRRQHQLKISNAQAADKWDMANKFDVEKREEDEALKEQKGQFKLNKVRLHARCVKYLVDYSIEVASDQRDRLKNELSLLFERLPEKAKSEELPSEDSTDTYPSEELIEQFSKAAVVLNRLNRRINSMASLWEQNEIDLISEEMQPAITKAYDANNWNSGERLRAKQASREKALLEANTRRRKERDAQSKKFSDRLTTYVTAHNGRKQARLNAIANGRGDDSGATSHIDADQMNDSDDNKFDAHVSVECNE